MKNILVSILSVAIICISQKPVMADESPATRASGSKKTDIEKVVEQAPSAITLGIVDGIIRYVNNEKRVEIRLQWEPMPPTSSLRERVLERELEVTTLEINNNDIKDGNWSRNISESKQKILKTALGVNDLKTLDFKNGSNLEDLDRNLKVSDYIRMQRERNILKVLLLSRGVQYSFQFKPTDESILIPDFSRNKNIIWKINIYSFKENDNESQLYRFTAKAVVESFDEKIPEDVIFTDNTDNAKQKVSYDARFKLNKSEAISSIAKDLFSLPDGSFVVPSTGNSKNFDSTTKNQVISSLASLSGFFSFFGGSEQFGTTVEGILGGTENISIVSGGLIGFKNGGVSALVGVNQELGQISDDISAGVILGVGLGEKTSLFLGPSIRSSIFTLSAGATLGTQTNSEVNFAGLIGIDLSRLTSSKKDSQQIKVSGSSQGGGLGEITEETIKRYTAVEYTSDRDILMTRICDEKSVLIAEADKNPITFSKASDKTRMYVIRGFYEYKSAKGDKVYYPNYTNDKLIKIDQPISSDGKQGQKPLCTEAKAATSDKPSK